MKLKYPLIFLAGIAASLLIIYLVIPNIGSISLSSKNFSEKIDPDIKEDASNLYSDDAALFSYIHKFGIKKAQERLVALEGAGAGDCHQRTHKAGRYSYEIYDDKAFQLCSASCHSGCYHGATEAYFRDKGTANLAENLKILCTSELNPFFSHQCVHGIGHGLMAWSDYEIFDALKSCDLLPQRQDSCWSGVFMENIVGGLASEMDGERRAKFDGHFTKYLNQDPHYPCNDPGLDPKYISTCYFLQTSRMVQLLNYDFAKVAKECSKASKEYKRVCFESMGRDVGGTYKTPEDEIKGCSNAPKGEMRIGCLIGAVQDSFWVPEGQDITLKFCRLLTDGAEKESCYNTIFGRAPEVISNKTELQTFCSKAEANFQEKCRSHIPA